MYYNNKQDTLKINKQISYSTIVSYRHLLKNVSTLGNRFLSGKNEEHLPVVPSCLNAGKMQEK